MLVPINLLLRKRPEDMGLRPDGDGVPLASAPVRPSNVVDPVWAAVDWTVSRAVRTARFWWLALAYFCALYAWYVGLQVHLNQIPAGDRLQRRNDALPGPGLVSLIGVVGQIALGPCVRSYRPRMDLGHSADAGICDLLPGIDRVAA